MIVEGQILGGAAQGLGYALSEGFISIQERARRSINGFSTYGLHRSWILPDIEPVMVELGEPTHPFGAKGCSEISYVGVAPAIANAIFNATGARVTELPMTPDVDFKALQDVKENGA